MNFPDRTTAIGKMINDFLINKVELGNEAIHLLFSANRWENMKRINDTLK
jgi:dTMP kinase